MGQGCHGSLFFFFCQNLFFGDTFFFDGTAFFAGVGYEIRDRKLFFFWRNFFLGLKLFRQTRRRSKTLAFLGGEQHFFLGGPNFFFAGESFCARFFWKRAAVFLEVAPKELFFWVDQLFTSARRAKPPLSAGFFFFVFFFWERRGSIFFGGGIF